MALPEFFEKHPVGRTQGRDLQLLAYQLQGPGRRATMIAMDHVSSPRFFETVARVMESVPGTVLKESTEASGDTAYPHPEQLALLSVYSDYRYKVVQCLRMLDFDVVAQRNVLRFPEGRTERADLTLEEMCTALLDRGFSFDVFRAMKGQVEQLQHTVHALCAFSLSEREAMFPGHRETFERELGGDANREKRAKEKSPFERWPALGEVVCGVREAKLIKRILEGTDDVIVPWGAGHFPAVHAALVETGEWTPDETSVAYLTRYTLQHIS